MRVARQLAAQAQRAYHLLVSIGAFAAKVPQEGSAAPDQHEQPAPGVMVVLVQLQMLGEMADAGGEDPYLDLCRARIVLVALELFDDFLLSTAVRQICTYGNGPRQRAAEANVVSGGHYHQIDAV